MRNISASRITKIPTKFHQHLLVYLLIAITLAPQTSWAVPPRPGNLNPSWKPCKYVRHVNDCKDDALKYCKDFPNPGECLPIIILPNGIPNDWDKKSAIGHAMAVTRSCYTDAASPGYPKKCVNCIIETTGTPEPVGGCWITPNDGKLRPFPRTTQQNLCEHLKELELPCENGLTPEIIIPISVDELEPMCELDDPVVTSLGICQSEPWVSQTELPNETLETSQ